MRKTFRGVMSNDTNKRIRLKTNDGKTGYLIRKFQIISTVPLSTASKALCKVYSTPDGVNANTDEIDLRSPTLLAICMYTSSGSVDSYPEDMTIIIDDKKFNQDIYLTMRNTGSGNNDMNYYLELEQVSLDLNEATVATLKDMRGRE